LISNQDEALIVVHVAAQVSKVEAQLSMFQNQEAIDQEFKAHTVTKLAQVVIDACIACVVAVSGASPVIVETAHAVNQAAVQVTLVITQEAGVHKAGVTNVGDVANTNDQVQVSSLHAVINCAEVKVKVLLHKSIVLFVRVFVVADRSVSTADIKTLLDTGEPQGSSTRYIKSVTNGVALASADTLLDIIIWL
jgi:hypothetical protein